MKNNSNTYVPSDLRREFDKAIGNPKQAHDLRVFADRAAKAGDVSILKDLHKMGMDLKKMNIYSGICSGGHLDALKYILEVQGDRKHCAFYAAGVHGQSEITDYLISRDRTPNDLSNGLMGAAMGGHLDIVKRYALEGGNLRYNAGEGLRIAYEEGHAEVCEFLEVVKAVNKIHDTMSQWEMDHIQVLQDCDGAGLLQQQIPIRDNNGETMFYLPYMVYAAYALSPERVAAKVAHVLPADLSSEVAPHTSYNDLLTLLNLKDAVDRVRHNHTREQRIKSLPDRMPVRPPLKRRFKK